MVVGDQNGLPLIVAASPLQLPVLSVGSVGIHSLHYVGCY